MRTTHYVWVLVLLLAGVTALLVHLIEPDSGVRHDRATSSAGRVDPNERFAGAERARGATRAGEEKQVEVQLEPRAELSGVARTECDGIPSPPLKIIATTRRLPEHGSQGPLPIPDLPAEILWGFFDHTRVPDGAVYAQMDRTEAAARAAEAVRRIDPRYERLMRFEQFKNAADIARVEEGLRKAGL